MASHSCGELYMIWGRFSSRQGGGPDDKDEIYNMEKADHLFISYAGEDWIFADWLARKLTAEGYLVWFDRLKLLGGESYPKNIDAAIKTRTFRLIALLSKNSISKPNPVKERTLALSISRERKIDFLIPLNLDGLKATELDWMTSDLTFIPFSNNWHPGLLQLLKKLSSIEAPKPIANGRQLAASSYAFRRPTHANGERLISNVLPAQSIPRTIYQYQLNRSIPKLENNAIENLWARLIIGNKELLSFQQPPKNLQAVKVIQTRQHSIDQSKIAGIHGPNVISALLYKSVWNEFIRLGCKQTLSRPSLFFPSGLLPKNQIKFVNYTGKPSYVLASGTRSFWRLGKKELFYYHLCPSFRIRQDLPGPFYLQLNPRLYFTDSRGNALAPRSALSRRKKVAKSWFNHQWLSRTMAIRSFLAKANEQIVIDERIEEGAIIFKKFERFYIKIGILEDENVIIDDIIDVTDEDNQPDLVH